MGQLTIENSLSSQAQRDRRLKIESFPQTVTQSLLDAPRETRLFYNLMLSLSWHCITTQCYLLEFSYGHTCVCRRRLIGRPHVAGTGCAWWLRPIQTLKSHVHNISCSLHERKTFMWGPTPPSYTLNCRSDTDSRNVTPAVPCIGACCV